ncbi:DUF4325 domain-containing protein [Rhodovarius crocodyli]|uniref:DUF4325 domain-containing protein n=1 Tax=Rhodovarius crocodyli TaxID=1979269 RepID=A0A437MNA1_9PROT|nr:STAS-like domain-containing protein [Rhodovarius crocodyli]RVT99116.1 DUF4325 domain-containing protein [Rhodovarius crocodyli]
MTEHLVSTGSYTIDVARDFSAYPGGRYARLGPFSGEAFRKEQLEPALQRGGNVIVILDGAESYPVSFLEEAFGGLVRVSGYSKSELEQRLKIQASKPRLATLRDLAWNYINKAPAKSK